jgi:hypothetical protein
MMKVLEQCHRTDIKILLLSRFDDCDLAEKTAAGRRCEDWKVEGLPALCEGREL